MQTEEVQAEEVQTEEPEMAEETQNEVLSEAVEEIDMAEIDAKATVSGFIPVKMSVTGNEALDAGAITYGSGNPLGDYCGYSQAVSFSGKGTVIIAVNNIEQSSSDIDYGIFRDKNLTDAVDSCGASARGTVTQRAFKIPAAGTYYIGLRSSKGYGTSYYYYAGVAAAYYSGVDRTLSNGVQIAVGQKDEQTNYFKFKATANGYITAAYIDPSAGFYKVAICNSSKKELSGYTHLRYNPTYGVKKGTTYYIKVVSGYNSDGGYIFKVTNSAVSEKSGKTKSKAVTIKKGKTKKGTIVAGSSQADWYKFKMTKKKAAKIYVKGRTNDKLKVILYKGGKKIKSYTYTYTTGAMTLKSFGKLSKGTYYIKVQRANKNSSGWYSLKWK